MNQAYGMMRIELPNGRSVFIEAGQILSIEELAEDDPVGRSKVITLEHSWLHSSQEAIELVRARDSLIRIESDEDSDYDDYLG